MVIGKVLPDNISGSNILGESTTNNNKYVSRLPTISPIKFTNSISIDSTRSSINNNDVDEYEQDTTTIIHNSNNKNFNKNIFTPNTATTAVDSNDSRQDLKLKKLRQFSEASAPSGHNRFDDLMVKHKSLQPQQINFVDNNNYYEEEEENHSFDNDEIFEYNGINESMEYLKEREMMLELEQKKLELEKEQMKLRISRSASLRNFKNLSPKKHTTNNNFMLSRSSSIHSNIQDFVPSNERQPPKLNNAKSMLNLRPGLNTKKSTQSNAKLKEYQPPAPRQELNFPRYKSMGNLRINSLNEDNRIQRKQSVYLRPRVSSNSLYEQKLRKKPSYYSTQSNAHYDLSPRHLGSDQSPRHRANEDEYRSINEQPSGIYNVQGDYLDEESEEEYDETFYEDFDMNANNNHKLMNYKPSNLHTPVDYWSVPKELFTYEDLQRQYDMQYENPKYMRAKLKPIQKQNMHKELHLKNFEERYSTNNKYYKKMKVYDPSLYMNKIKDGYVSGMMKYDGKEKRWLGGDRTMEYLPDFDSFKSSNHMSPNVFGKAKVNHHKPKISMSNFKMKSYPSMKNLKLNNPNLDIHIDTNFNAGVLSKWYAYENDIQGMSDRWVGDVEVDEWEIYDLVRSST